jgi:hypothetical protein
VEVITAPSTGQLFSCPRYNHKISRRAFEFNRLQFPLKLAYAVTVHKAQGMTLTRCVIDFRAHASHRGCVYTALSRVRLPEHLGVIMPLDGFGPVRFVVNVVAPNSKHPVMITHKTKRMFVFFWFSEPFFGDGRSVTRFLILFSKRKLKIQKIPKKITNLSSATESSVCSCVVLNRE